MLRYLRIHLQISLIERVKQIRWLDERLWRLIELLLKRPGRDLIKWSSRVIPKHLLRVVQSEAERRVAYIACLGMNRGALVSSLHGLLIESFRAEV